MITQGTLFIHRRFAELQLYYDLYNFFHDFPAFIVVLLANADCMFVVWYPHMLLSFICSTRYQNTKRKILKKCKNDQKNKKNMYLFLVISWFVFSYTFILLSANIWFSRLTNFDLKWNWSLIDKPLCHLYAWHIRESHVCRLCYSSLFTWASVLKSFWFITYLHFVETCLKSDCFVIIQKWNFVEICAILLIINWNRWWFFV